jgi:formylglycine-generating enzyme required for sulfatase activity
MMGRVPLFLLLAALGVCAGAPSLAAGARFKDCPDCPEMIAVPGGTVLMGSPQDEAQRDENKANNDEDDLEGPGGQQVRVAVRPFALGAYEITRAQYRAFLQSTGRPARGGCISILKGEYRSHPEGRWDNTGGPNGDSLPVSCVDWYEARTYAAWLSARTGHHYRLPSEAEFEYALRAGTTTRFFWGDDQEQVCRYGNVPDAAFHAAAPSRAAFRCNDGYVLESPVGSFAPNPWGFYDMTGNMFEWLADCYHRSYAGLPRDGTPFESARCEARSVRGGSVGYYWGLAAFRSADRSDDKPEEAWYGVGFRVARDR